jgi:signal transduction histidine kinase
MWSYANQTTQAEKEMLEKTQILNQELKAVWDFIDINQKRIDTDADGSLNFKNIYCAIAGKSVAALFMRETDYEVRYVSLTPRNLNSRADDFEKTALTSFVTAAKSNDIYEISRQENKEVFRYISPIYMQESCLSCHGEPKGERDITNYPKEGLRTGDLAGAVSIVMPIDLYMQGIRQNILQQSLYFFTVLAILIVIAYFAISYLVRRLEKTNTLLQQESSYKSDFLAIMSHELKTPLTSIIAFTEIWEKSSKDTDKQQRAIVEVKENGYILLEMVNNILEAARIDAGRSKIHREWVDMVDLLSTVEGTVRPLVDKKNLSFTTSVSPEVPLIYADWEKLRRVVENLVSNAIKFTKPGGKVAIEVDTSGEMVRIKVKDTGIGIKEEDINRLFEKFLQLDQSAQRRYRGSGLGLAVVKELVAAHDGTVEVHSVYKEGSSFTVSIPIRSAPNILENEEI